MDTRAKAITSLIKDHGGIAKLTLVERATALVCLSELAPGSAITNDIFASVNQEKYYWVKNAGLSNMIVAALSLHLVDRLSLDGKLLGTITSRLIKAEIKPGGPYANNGSVDLLTNARILQLAAALGLRLQGAEEYTLEALLATKSGGLAHGLYFALNHPSRLFNETPGCSTRPARGLTAKIVELYASLDDQVAPRPALHNSDRDRTASNTAKGMLSSLAEPARTEALRMWKLIDDADSSGEISNIVKFFSESLLRDGSTPLLLANQLGALNMLTWIAYTLYDNILDGDRETGAHLLPTANVVHRLAYKNYLILFPQYASIIDRYFDSVDLGNAWEVQNARATVTADRSTIRIARLPNYEDGSLLARRALGHTLGIAIAAREAQATTHQIKELERAMAHYLIAKQISDDLYDWREDLKNGNLSFVVTYLLRSMNPDGRDYSLNDAEAILRPRFSKYALANLCQLIISHTDACTNALNLSGLTSPNSYFERVIIGAIKEKAKGALYMKSEQEKFQSSLDSALASHYEQTSV